MARTGRSIVEPRTVTSRTALALLLPAMVTLGLLVAAGAAQAAPTWVQVKAERPLPRGAITEVAFVGRKTGWVSGYFRHPSGEMRTAIARTTDGGRRWRVQQWGGRYGDIRGLFMLDARTGWAVSNGAILHTSDGRDWRVQYRYTPPDPLTPEDHGLWLRSVAFDAEGRRGVAVGFAPQDMWVDKPVVLRTEDGGATWAWQEPGGPGGGSGPVVFAGERVFSLSSTFLYLQYSLRLFGSPDAGAAWDELYARSGPESEGGALLSDLAALGSERPLAIGSAWPSDWDYTDPDTGVVLKSLDAGGSWTETLYPGKRFGAVTFANRTCGWIAGETRIRPYTWRTAIFGSADGGATWKAQYRARDVRVHDVDAVSRFTVWAGGENGATGRPVLLRLEP